METSTYRENARDIPVLATAEVLVVGGGPGGVGAAIAAARNGARTILVERFGSLGGTWTTGLLGAIMTFPFVHGIFDEIVAELVRREGWVAWGDGTHGKGGTYDVELLKSVLDTLVVQADVTPYFFTQIVDVIRDGARLKGIIVETKEGRGVILADIIIDASGDGDVCVRAGVPFSQGREEDGATQPMTLIFKMDGVDDARAAAAWKADPDYANAWRAAKARGEVTVPREDVLAVRNPKRGQWTFNTTRILGKDPTKVRDITDAMIEGRRQVVEVAAFMRRHVPGFENAVLSETGAHIGVRESRRILADYTIGARDIIEALPVDDCIARGNWYIDIHNPDGEGTRRMYPPEGKWYEIPYRSLCARGLDNVLVASRCIDTTHEAHAAVRITPQITAIGQGAGTAAALCVRQRLPSTRAINIAELRETLRRQGAFV